MAVFKTAKFIGQQVVPIDRRLWKVIKVHQHAFDRPDYLFGGSAPMTTTKYTDVVRAVMKRHTGKRLGSRMLRKMYLTHTHGHIMEALQKSIQERAKAMGHSVASSYGYIRPKASPSQQGESTGKTEAPV